jgi:hypothetical protein
MAGKAAAVGEWVYGIEVAVPPLQGVRARRAMAADVRAGLEAISCPPLPQVCEAKRHRGQGGSRDVYRVRSLRPTGPLCNASLTCARIQERRRQ